MVKPAVSLVLTALNRCRWGFVLWWGTVIVLLQGFMLAGMLGGAAPGLATAVKGGAAILNGYRALSMAGAVAVAGSGVGAAAGALSGAHNALNNGKPQPLQMSGTGNEIEKVYVEQVGTKNSRPYIYDTLRDIKSGQAASRKAPFDNRHKLLPASKYEYYNVSPDGSAKSDWRLVHDIVNDKWYFSGNFHQKAPGSNSVGSGAKFVEIDQPFALVGE